MQILDEAARYIPQRSPATHRPRRVRRRVGAGVRGGPQHRARRRVPDAAQRAHEQERLRARRRHARVPHVGPNSLAAIMDWLGEHVEKARIRDLAAQVRELNIGQALVVSPGLAPPGEGRADPRARDVRLERDAEAGQSAKRVTAPAAKPDLAKYQQRMAATIEKVKADDPKALRAAHRGARARDEVDREARRRRARDRARRRGRAAAVSAAPGARASPDRAVDHRAARRDRPARARRGLARKGERI
jgi:hypothetical protein